MNLSKTLSEVLSFPLLEGSLPALGERTNPRWAVWVARATWAFVALGVAARVLRYLMCFPLWGDEAFLAVNFPDRSYRELMGPLEYGQVCPLLFLWIELALVRLCGYCEWSLRLFPVVCGVAAVFVFRHLAARIVRGVPLLLAVAVFSVSYYPIRHACEVKPYASDLLTALGLMTLALEWLRAPGQSRWLWILAAVTPLCLGLSYPAVFVAGGLSLALLPTVVQRREVRTWAPFAVFNLLLAGTFLLLFLLVARGQYDSSVEAAGTTVYWERSFPPVWNPFQLAVWFVSTHTGRMFGYPIGGNYGASTLTFGCFVIGAILLWRNSARQPLAVLLAPFALTFVAAALERYPYGGSGRVAQYLAPSICLLAGLGGAALIAAGRATATRRRAVLACCGVFAVFGGGFLVADVVRPYKQYYDWQVRDVWRTLWRETAQDAELVCVWRDLQEPFADEVLTATGGTRAQYLCNQRIYAPRGWRPGAPRWEAVSPQRPLRCVLFQVAEMPDFRSDITDWLTRMQTRYRLAGCEKLDLVCSYRSRTGRPTVRFEVYEFLPRRGGAQTAHSAPIASSPDAPQSARR